MKPILVPFLLGALLLPLPAFAQSDDFEDGDHSNWTKYNPLGSGTFTIVNGGFRFQTPPSPSPQTVGPGRAGATRAEIYSNFYVAVDVVNWNDSLDQAFGILARMSNIGAGTTRGYAFTYDRGSSPTSGDMDISVITNEAPSGITVSGEDSIHLVPGNSYRFVFLGRGSVLEGRVYLLPDVETPLVRVIGSDNTYASGTAGLVVYDTSGTMPTDTTYDNYFAASQEPVKLSIRISSFNEAVVAWTTNTGPWRLQVATNLALNPIPWVDIPDNFIFPFGNELQYTEEPEPGEKYFRLIQD